MQCVGGSINRLLYKTHKLFLTNPTSVRTLFSRPKNEENEQTKHTATKEEPTAENQKSEPKVEENPEIIALKSKNETLEHQLKYAVAELKNLQNRIKKQVDEAYNFGASKFIKDMLVVADTMETVISKTPKDMTNPTSSTFTKEECENLCSLLKDLLIGIEMTNSMLQKTFTTHNVIKSTPLGEDFDPNFHMAKFEIPKDATKVSPGKVGEIVRPGYTFNGRVLRAAEVGVVKK